MTLAMTAEQQAAAGAVRSWADRAAPVAAMRREDHDHRSLWAGLADLGIFAAGIPADVGGAGGTFGDAAVLLSAAAQVLAPGPVLGTVLTAHLLARSGQDSELLRLVAAGQAPIGLGLTTAAEDAGALFGNVRALGATDQTMVLLPIGGDRWALLDAGTAKVSEQDGADLSRACAEVLLDGARPRLVLGGGWDLLIDPARRRGRRGRRVVPAYRRRAREGARTVRPPDRLVPGDSASVQRDAVPRPARGGGRVGCRPARRGSAAAPARRCRGRRRRIGRGSGHREGLHPGARRDRLHLGTRRASLPAAGACRCDRPPAARAAGDDASRSSSAPEPNAPSASTSVSVKRIERRSVRQRSTSLRRRPISGALPSSTAATSLRTGPRRTAWTRTRQRRCSSTRNCVAPASPDRTW